MSIRVNCRCGKLFQVKPKHAGRHLKCPGCATLVPIPASAEEQLQVPVIAPGLVSGSCDRHPGQPPTSGTCQICQAALCRSCLEELGYFCSTSCKSQAQEQWAPAVVDQTPFERAKRMTSLAGYSFRVIAIATAILATAGVAYFLTRPQGELIWQTKSKSVTYLPPALDGEQLVVATNKKKLLIIDAASGKLLRELALPDIPSPVPPLLVDQIAIVACSRTVAGCDLNTGRIVWTYKPPVGHVCRRLAASPGGVIAQFQPVTVVPINRQDFLSFTGNATIHCLDPKSGAKNWSSPADQNIRLPIWIGHKEILLLEASDKGRSLHRIDSVTGRPTKKIRLTGESRFIPSGPGGIVQTDTQLTLYGPMLTPLWQRKDLAYAGHGSGLVFAYSATFDLEALDAKTGKTRWSKAVDTEQPPMAVNEHYVVLRASAKAAPPTKGAGGHKSILKKMQLGMAAGGSSAPALQILKTSDGQEVVRLEPGAYEAHLHQHRLILIRGKASFTLAGFMSYREDSSVIEFSLPSGKEAWRAQAPGYFHHTTWASNINRLYLLTEFHPPGVTLRYVPKRGQYWENQLYGFSLR